MGPASRGPRSTTRMTPSTEPRRGLEEPGVGLEGRYVGPKPKQKANSSGLLHLFPWFWATPVMAYFRLCSGVTLANSRGSTGGASDQNSGPHRRQVPCPLSGPLFLSTLRQCVQVCFTHFKSSNPRGLCHWAWASPIRCHSSGLGVGPSVSLKWPQLSFVWN